MNWFRIFLTISVVTLTSCGPTIDSEVKALVFSKNQWLEATKNGSYEFTMESRCNHMHCTVDSKRRIKVVGGEVVAAEDLLGTQVIDDVSKVSSVKSIFFVIFDIIEGNAHLDSPNWDIEYHDTLGYPKHVIYDPLEIYIYDVVIE